MLKPRAEAQQLNLALPWKLHSPAAPLRADTQS